MDEELPRVVCPFTVNPPVADALVRDVCPVTVRRVTVVVASVEVPVT